MSLSQTNDVACTKCKFFDDHVAAQSVSKESDEGLCRFNPPVSQPSAESHGLWPVVGATDWCGHFSLDGMAGTAD